MKRNLFGGIHLRPGNLYKDFSVKRLETRNANGYTKDVFVESDLVIKGILADADNRDSDKMKHMWDQDKHSLTHTLVIREKYPDLKKGDYLSNGNRHFLVLTVTDVADLGKAGIICLEERNDLE